MVWQINAKMQSDWSYNMYFNDSEITQSFIHLLQNKQNLFLTQTNPLINCFQNNFIKTAGLMLQNIL
jgi:hypothetical protein